MVAKKKTNKNTQQTTFSPRPGKKTSPTFSLKQQATARKITKQFQLP